MINLKLAQYDLRNGKFVKFLECGDGFEKFMYGKDCISCLAVSCIDPRYYDLDKKDPLNRFDGLFNGRTYGNGEFVLIELDSLDYSLDDVLLMSRPDFLATGQDNMKSFESFTGNPGTFKDFGNLHENPELWEKL